MKLKELITEMPWHKQEDLALSKEEGDKDPFEPLPLEDFQSQFKVLVNRQAGQQQLVIGIAHHERVAMAAIVDGDLVRPRCVLEFQDLNFEHEIEGPCLQVGMVQAEDNQQGTGFGYELYKAVLKAGYAIISDYTQYNGGRAMWEKILRRAGQDGHYVLIMDKGELRCAPNGSPIKYNGSNMDAQSIWGGRDKSYTLLVAINNDRRIARQEAA